MFCIAISPLLQDLRRSEINRSPSSYQPRVVVGYMDDISLFLFDYISGTCVALALVELFSEHAGPILNKSKCVLVPLFKCEISKVNKHVVEVMKLPFEVAGCGKCLGIYLGKGAREASWKAPCKSVFTRRKHAQRPLSWTHEQPAPL